MSVELAQSMQQPARSDTIPILNARMICASPSVMRDKRGGCQTRKASNIVLHEPGWPSFGPAPAHHPDAYHRLGTAHPRLPCQYGMMAHAKGKL
jgi:hypothetical protein